MQSWRRARMPLYIAGKGVGRSGLMAACLLVTRGQEPGSAVMELERARGTAVPETAEQRAWIDLYASSVTRVK